MSIDDDFDLCDLITDSSSHNPTLQATMASISWPPHYIPLLLYSPLIPNPGSVSPLPLHTSTLPDSWHNTPALVPIPGPRPTSRTLQRQIPARVGSLWKAASHMSCRRIARPCAHRPFWSCRRRERWWSQLWCGVAMIGVCVSWVEIDGLWDVFRRRDRES